MRLLLYLMILTLLVSVKIETGVLAQDAVQEQSKRLAAKSAYDEGERLRQQKTAESLRKAIAKYNEALLLWKEVGDSKGQAEALSGIGELYFLLGENRLALDHFNQLLQVRRSLEDRQGEGATLNDIGVVYFTLGEPQKALEHYRQALPLRRDMGDTEGEATTLNNIGAAFRVMGESQQALEYYKQGLVLRRAFGDPGAIANSLTNIGALYYRLGDPQQALDYYGEALPLRHKASNPAGEAITLTNIGAAHLALGDARQAIEYLDQALPLVQKGQRRAEEAQALNFLAFASYVLGDRQKALNYFEQALKLWRAVEERQGEASALVGMGRVFREQGERRLAFEHLERALQLARDIGETNTQAVALASIALVERDQGDLNQAKSRIEEALDLVESMRARTRSADLRTSFLASKYGDYEFYIDLLMRLNERQPSAGFDALAFEASERARGRNLLDVFNLMRADIRQGIDPLLLDRQRTLQQQINVKEQLRMESLAKKQKELSAAIEKEMRSLLGEYKELQGQIHARNPRYAALTDPVTLKLKEVRQQVLDANTLLLEYAIGEERSFLWAVSPSSLKVYTLPGRAQIKATALRAYDRLTKSNQRAYTGSAALAMAELSHMVLGPVAAELGRKRLLIVSDGALQFVPFGALPEPGVGRSTANKQRPLIVNHEIINLPSASVLATMRREQTERQATPRTVAVFSDPVFQPDDPRVKQATPTGERPKKETADSRNNETNTESALVRSAKETGVMSFERLIFTRKEAEAIAALALPDQGLKALDFAASRETVMNAGLDQYRIIHFATHGLLNSQHPELSGIVLSLVDEHGRPREGFLRLHEVYNMKLNAELVVLSACSTGLGKEIKGEGLIGLTRGFMYAGTARVMASLWNVRDEATAELMKRFYRNMLAGKLSPAAALREAQVSMWREPRWAAPYYWAGFVLQGEWK